MSAAPRLTRPLSATPLRINWRYAVFLGLLHFASLLAFFPWFFSWSGVALCVCGYLLFGTLGISVGYHRLLTHRSFKCPKWLEYLLAMLGCCCGQESPARWVAIHRLHHAHTDQQSDPHSPRAGLLWGYFGWLLVINDDHWQESSYRRLSRDLLRQPFYAGLEKRLGAMWLFMAHLVLLFAAGFFWMLAAEADWRRGIQFGSSLTVWGGVLRTTAVLHAIWSVNAFSHLWGYRNYATEDDSRNNWLCALLAFGDWHNNHHGGQRLAAHGRQWWEIDLSYWTICLFELLGLATDVVREER